MSEAERCINAVYARPVRIKCTNVDELHHAMHSRKAFRQRRYNIARFEQIVGRDFADADIADIAFEIAHGRFRRGLRLGRWLPRRDPFGGAHVLSSGTMVSRSIRDSVVEVLEEEGDIHAATRQPGSG